MPARALLVASAVVSLSSVHARDLTFDDRVIAQEAIERVYYSHRIGATAPFEQAVPRAMLEAKVRTYLEKSAALDDESLERELARIASRTTMPERLHEIEVALGNDPLLLRECLARPLLAERLSGEAPATLSPRSDAPAVWTGSEMILWGGLNGALRLGTGLRYDPATDTWTATSMAGAPSPRTSHTLVWTGTEMIVFGGFDGTYRGDGARYDPVSDTWTPVPETARGRASHTAVWTGTEMIVFGGSRERNLLGTGARYDPVSDRWIETTRNGAPIKRTRHTAVWTGTEMIVWGGHCQDKIDSVGGIYDPVTDSWTETSPGPDTREGHTAVWTGTEMIIWGGSNTHPTLKIGAVYNPAGDFWNDTPFPPHSAKDHTAVWTGTEMLVWGGTRNLTGIRYDPAAHTIQILAGGGDRPDATKGYSAVWTGDRMIVWGGGTNTGAVFDPLTNQWTATSTEGPSGQ